MGAPHMTVMQKQSVHDFGIDWDDFYTRWTRARISALSKATGVEGQGQDLTRMELNLLLHWGRMAASGNEARANEVQELVLKNVFDFSRALSMGLSRMHHVTFDMSDIREILGKAKLPCTGGRWTTREAAEVLSRPDCGTCPSLGARVCDYWREAIDGLVMGLGELERYVRHACARHGDDLCVDVLFMEGQRHQPEGLAWGPLPEPMGGVLADICKAFASRHKAGVQLLGIKEGVLHYILEKPTDEHCGHGGSLLARWEEEVHQIYPGLHMLDVTPRAVLGVEA